MRLLPTSPDVALDNTQEYIGSLIPPYAILSHTWGPDEVTLQELKFPSISTSDKKGFEKIQKTTVIARTRDALEYAWVDTCCIDKSSSAELTEAINSMYAWYAQAHVCYVYLEDLPPGPDSDLDVLLPRCRWFTRGWTLQELIAPQTIIFFDREWNERGDKKGLSGLLCHITGIPIGLLKHETTLGQYAVARKMSWAASRETTRIEDSAYCLLGIFDVNLSLIYGEGKKAFIRLQEAILLAAADLSIFIWTDDSDACNILTPILADSAQHFARCSNAEVALEDTIYRELMITTRGIQLQGCLIGSADHEDDLHRSLFDPYCTIDGIAVGFGIRKVGGGRFARYKPDRLAIFGEDHRSTQHTNGWTDLGRMPFESLVLATTLSTNFPFPAKNVVLGNRNCAIRVHMENDPKLSVQRSRAMPRSHWDLHDEVFFCSNVVSKGWSALFVHGTLELNSTTCIPVNFLVWCSNWNIRKPNIFVGSLHDLEPAITVLLESQLQNLPLESCLQAEGLVLSIFGAGVTEPVSAASTVLNTVTMESKQIPVVSPKSRVHSRAQHVGEKVAVELMAHIEEDHCPELCIKPMWRLSVGWKILDRPSRTDKIET
ncbi:vegetative incompatibility protein HET-E-1 [Echria macrotheca]|uniref:Vegetative incompatibility protein HET-E-1 n=1 Tax=Echria macrotheca TaxID=438768 RepID=A0AAJ0BEG6_9PEZI|nr:vegetative incompatibility protein HET-E-1 [Echria macrotheca]